MSLRAEKYQVQWHSTPLVHRSGARAGAREQQPPMRPIANCRFTFCRERACLDAERTTREGSRPFLRQIAQRSRRSAITMSSEAVFLENLWQQSVDRACACSIARALREATAVQLPDDVVERIARHVRPPRRAVGLSLAMIRFVYYAVVW